MYTSSLMIHLPSWTVTNLVIQFYINEKFIFNKLQCNAKLSYEPELFPALLVSSKNSAHVTLFPNGKGIITGVCHPAEAILVLQETLTDLKLDVRQC